MRCDESILLELIDSDDNDVLETARDEETALHIAGCAKCQRRLTQLAADHDSWNDVASALGNETTESSVVIAIDAELSDEIPLQADPISLDFLDSPSHPEMLGRIGRYDIERLIGAGGMGIVLKAFDTELHRPVAIKVLAPHLAHSGAARQRFAREAQSAAAVVHENVVPIHNVDVAGKLPFLVMQYVAGESLQARVDRLGPLSTEEVLRIGAQVASGLSAAHEQGLVHRDVKPGNVLLEESVDRVLISDFGLARAADDASVTRSGVIAGTPHYMSPEQARGEAIDVRSDLFGLGSVLYFMCVGRPPFRADGAMATLHRICLDQHRPVDEVNEQVPAPLAELIDDLLQKEASRRPSTAAEVSRQLNRQLTDKRSRSRFRKTGKRNIGLALRGTVGALVMAGCGFVALVSWPWLANRWFEPSSTTSAMLTPQTPASTSPLPNNGTLRALPPPAAPPQETVAPQSIFVAPQPPSPAVDPIPAFIADPFEDAAFFAEINALNQLAEDLEMSPREAPVERRPDSWSANLDAARELADAITNGANDFTIPIKSPESSTTGEGE